MDSLKRIRVNAPQYEVIDIVIARKESVDVDREYAQVTWTMEWYDSVTVRRLFDMFLCN